MQKTKTTETRIMDLVSSEARFSKFNEAIKAAGLTERFSSPNNFTVFAPTNEAFDKLPKDRAVDLLKPENREYLKNLLLLHVVPGALMAEDLKKADTLKTEGGQAIKVIVSPDMKQIKLGSGEVVLPREEAKNGFVYPLDTVLWPTALAAKA
jgi:uncharacterized surface protein with fasciclin (FAS1) repeats